MNDTNYIDSDNVDDDDELIVAHRSDKITRELNNRTVY